MAVEKVLEFWFSAKHSNEYGNPRSFWFNSTPSIDFDIQQKFSNLYQNAKNGALNDLKETPEGMLTLIILFDQMPRHLFRNTKDAFETNGEECLLPQMELPKNPCGTFAYLSTLLLDIVRHL